MNNTRTYTVAELAALLKTSDGLEFLAVNRQETYVWIEATLYQYGYRKLRKPEKRIVLTYLEKMTGYSRVQVKRLAGRFVKSGHVKVAPYQRQRFAKRYQPTDIALLATVDTAHQVLSGLATKAILTREYQVFGKNEFERLAHISVSHLYNLRQTFSYRTNQLVFTKTKATCTSIGERKKPQPDNRPGFIRVDSVHQGDKEGGGKGVYHINLVDEVTQWELLACVETISERHLAPVLELVLPQFPFSVINFHSDNGSEFINQVVSKILAKLLITQTKSRPRRSNDNGLAETKNGAVVRKHLGYHHIPGDQATLINTWYQNYFNVYLNFHRPCGYPSLTLDAKGRRRVSYKAVDYQTPYDKLKSLARAEQFLKPGWSFAKLNQLGYTHSDTEFAQLMQKAKQELFTKIKTNTN